MKYGIIIITIFWISHTCGWCADKFAFKTLELPMGELKEWNIQKHEVQGEYYFEYGDGGGEIILKAFLADKKPEDLKFYGVIFEPSGMLEKQQIKVLPELVLKGAQVDIVNENLSFMFRKFIFEGKEIKGILYKGNFFAVDHKND